MIEQLMNVGFTEKEAKLYIYVAQEGECSAPKIATDLQLDRRTVYDVLSMLLKRGWVTRKSVNNRDVYSAVDPHYIIEEIKEKYENFKETITNIKRKEIQQPQITIIKGIKAVQIMLNNALDEKEEFLCMGRGGLLLEQLGGAKHQYVARIKKLKWKMIQTEKWKHEEFNLKFKPTELRYLPSIVKFDTAFITYGNKVYLTSKHEEIVVIEIVDEYFAKTFQEYFELFWEQAKP